MTAKIKANIGLIGVGNMGTAILEGVFSKKIASPSQVWIYDKLPLQSQAWMRRHKAVQLAHSGADVCRQAEIILLAVKPQDLKESLSGAEKFLTEKKVLITILAGTSIAKVKTLAGSKTVIVRAMPNLGAKVGESITALAGNDPSGMKSAEQLFSGCGKTLVLDEKYFDLVTAVSGSGPAYFFLLMEILMKKAVEEGLSQADARQLAIQTAAGAALLAQTSVDSPEELRKKVTSKGGTTEAALKVLMDKNVSAIFSEAVSAAIHRGRELNQK